jgi:hypothetical protein
MTQHEQRKPNPQRVKTDAALAKMTDADWDFIEDVVNALRDRYPGLHIEYGRW